MELDDTNNNATRDPTDSEQEVKLDSTDNLEEDRPCSPANKRIRFRVQWIDKDNEVIRQRETLDLVYKDEAHGSDEDPAFEIVTTFRSSKRPDDINNENKLLLTSVAPKRSMRILSTAIAHALRSIVRFYPSQDLTSDVIKIDYPYAVLVHYYDELMDYREAIGPNSSEEFCHRANGAYEDLEILKGFLDEHIMPAVEEERARNRQGFHSFEWMWVDLKPGTWYISHDVVKNEVIAGVIHSLRGGSFESPSISWGLRYWTMQYDGRVVARLLHDSTIAEWNGDATKTLRSLDLRVRPREEAVERCIDRGKIYWKLLEKQCKYFHGRAEEVLHRNIDGLVMVDIEEYYKASPINIPLLMENDVDNRKWISSCDCAVCSRRRSEYANDTEMLFNDLWPKTDPYVRDEEYFLFPRSIHAFDFKTRCWVLLPVDGFREPEFEEQLIENLVMNEHKLKTLKALSKSFARIDQSGERMTQEHWSADFVKGKGNGLIFLLHGKPGVGKTCTAECIAAYTSRPLMVLTSGDIGSEPKEVEHNLTTHFKRATHWGAVLLIDEADVFMERRSTADLTRNSLVAGFLRALEFYEGILFLTTNRVGFFDDAFISRIHVQLYYPDFDEVSRRKVWQTFIDKLEKERGDHIRLNAIAKEYLDGSELKAVKWNGREIRNAFQTAVALAEYEAKKDSEGKILLTDEHLKSVVELSKDFKDYLSKLHVGDEGKRAERRFERVDE